MRNGWKFLSPDGCTYYNGVETVYPLPRPNEKWGPWLEHPEPAQADGRDCGPGRWHVMARPSAKYAPSDWWVWYVQAENILGESYEKFSCTRLRLRRVSRAAFVRMFRLGWMRGANLTRANLTRANLTDADLTGADLTGADLTRADLTDADLTDADLRDADLRGANLTGAEHCNHTRWPVGLDAAAATGRQADND